MQLGSFHSLFIQHLNDISEINYILPKIFINISWNKSSQFTSISLRPSRKYLLTDKDHRWTDEDLYPVQASNSLAGKDSKLDSASFTIRLSISGSSTAFFYTRIAQNLPKTLPQALYGRLIINLFLEINAVRLYFRLGAAVKGRKEEAEKLQPFAAQAYLLLRRK